SPGNGVAEIDGPPVPDLLATWRASQHCAAPTTRVTGPVTRTDARCEAGRSVALITVAGAGHQWPGSTPARLARAIPGLDDPSPALDATATFWDFFAAHHR